MNRTSLVSLALVTVLACSSFAATPASALACGARIDDASIREALPSLLRTEGIPATATPPLAMVRPAELDGDPNTAEALVDLVQGELCGPALVCPTLVIVSRGGELRSVGSGRALVVLQSSRAGYRDLGDQSPSLIPFMPVVTRVLQWSGARYSP